MNVVCSQQGSRQFKVFITSEKSLKYVVITYTVKVIDCSQEKLHPRQEAFKYVVIGDIDSVVLVNRNFIGSMFSDLMETQNCKVSEWFISNNKEGQKLDDPIIMDMFKQTNRTEKLDDLVFKPLKLNVGATIEVRLWIYLGTSYFRKLNPIPAVIWVKRSNATFAANTQTFGFESGLIQNHKVQIGSNQTYAYQSPAIVEGEVGAVTMKFKTPQTNCNCIILKENEDRTFTLSIDPTKLKPTN